MKTCTISYALLSSCSVSQYDNADDSGILHHSFGFGSKLLDTIVIQSVLFKTNLNKTFTAFLNINLNLMQCL